jgi:hypothetical protein
MISDSPRTRGSRTTVLLVVLAVVAVIVGGFAVSRLAGDDPDDSTEPTTESSTGSSTSEEPLLVSPAAESWGSQTVDDCASYEPATEPEVVHVPHFTYECVTKVPSTASAIFSATSADELGGISWEKGSQPWVELSGRQVMKKVNGDEFNITSRVIQGVWVEEPSEFAVYVGPESPAALDALETTDSQ